MAVEIDEEKLMKRISYGCCCCHGTVPCRTLVEIALLVLVLAVAVAVAWCLRLEAVLLPDVVESEAYFWRQQHLLMCY